MASSTFNYSLPFSVSFIKSNAALSKEFSTFLQSGARVFYVSADPCSIPKYSHPYPCKMYFLGDFPVLPAFSSDLAWHIYEHCGCGYLLQNIPSFTLVYVNAL
jgi:hypothetical protein